MQIDFIDVEQKYHSRIRTTITEFFKSKNFIQDIYLSVNFVSKSKIKSLNLKYRNKNTPTDVLSFPIWKDKNLIPKEGKVNLGDIYICPEETDIDKKLPFLINHSLKHLIGIHHKL